MVKIELDINGISFFVNTTWKTDAVPAVGDIVIVDKESISQFDRVELRKTPSNQRSSQETVWHSNGRMKKMMHPCWNGLIMTMKWLSKNGRGNLMPKMKKWYVF